MPYKGSAPALTDVMNGQISYAHRNGCGAPRATSSPAALKALRRLHRAAHGRAARRAAARRSAPTCRGYDIARWIGYAAPAGTPRELVARLAGEIRKALASDELKERMISIGLDAVSSTPDEMAAFMRREQERYGAIIKNANIKVE